MIKRSETYIAIPPGETIKEQLNYKGMTQKDFSERMGYSEKHISRLINGHVQLTPDTAQRLESTLGAPAVFWLNLENNYRLELEKVKNENDYEEEKKLARAMPYAEAAKLGWVPKTKVVDEKIAAFRKFFGVAKLTLLEEVEVLTTLYRKLGATENSEYGKMIWIQQVQNITDETIVSPINISKLKENLHEIRKMTLLNPEEFLPKLESLLADCGIAFVLVPHFPGSFLHGATFVKNKKIVLGLTIRRKDADIFWFSLFHELAHILNGDIYQDEPLSNMEKKADNFAANCLIPSKDYVAFIEKNNFSDAAIIEFSKEQDIRPGIVVGRLQKEDYLNHRMKNHLKEQYELI